VLGDRDEPLAEGDDRGIPRWVRHYPLDGREPDVAEEQQATGCMERLDQLVGDDRLQQC